jgi:hypothetical protein
LSSWLSCSRQQHKARSNLQPTTYALTSSIYCYFYLSWCVLLSLLLVMPSLLAGDICSTQTACSFDNESLCSQSRTVSARLAAGISNNDGIAARLLYSAVRQTSQKVAVSLIAFQLEAKGRVVLADGVSRRRDWRRRWSRRRDWRRR